jgi:hypothetical protein
VPDVAEIEKDREMAISYAVHDGATRYCVFSGRGVTSG